MRRSVRVLVTLGLAMLVTGALPAAPAGCLMRVNDVSGFTGSWPLVGGLPLPQGAVRDPAQVRVCDARGREIPAQVDTAATYRDGSLRWALISLMAPPQGTVRAEYGPGVRRAAVQGLRITRDGGQVRVSTGAADFTLDGGNLLLQSAELTGADRVPLWGPGEHYAYLVDNQGRTARCAGPQAGVEITTLKDGPLRAVLRTEGWYVTDTGERLARGIARLSFFAGSPMVQISHSLIFTEDTNRLWLKDYGIEVPVRGGTRAVFDTSQAYDATTQAVALPDGASASLLQDDYPHFAETGSHFSLTVRDGQTAREVATGAACGEWCDLASDRVDVTVAVRDLAEQFPKELEARAQGIRVHLWPERSGRELDFRAATLVKNYWQSWAALAPGGAEALAKTASNAQGASKTHELWLMPHRGTPEVPAIARQCHAACQPPLLQADPTTLCASGALTWPVHPYDPQRFPAEEAMISDFFDRLTLPYKVFPMTGLIAWGCQPYLDFTRRDGKWYAVFYRLSQLVDYGMRRHVWTLYARSGDRRYYDYAARFDRFAADWEIAHVTAGQKIKGGFAVGDIHKPLYWGTSSLVLNTDISGHDIVNWLLEYYLTGDERALEATREFGEAVKQTWDLKAARAGYCPFVITRVLTALYTREWDESFHAMARDLAHQIIDPQSPNYLTNEMAYGALYKVDRNAAALYDYWWATGDDLARQAFLKAMDYQYRFNRIPPAIEYQNGGAYLLTIAYQWTGRPEYAAAVQQLVRGGLAAEGKPLAEELTGDPRLSERLPYRGVHLNMHTTLGLPTALALLAGLDKPPPSFPILVKSFQSDDATAIFAKPAGQAVTLGVYVQTTQAGEVGVQVLGPDGAPVAAEVKTEERIASYAPSQFRHFSLRVTVPAAAPAGLYQVVPGPTEEFVVQDASVPQVSLACPSGAWLGGGGLAAGMPLYFRVPPGQQSVDLLVGRPVTVRRPDGSVALEPTNEGIGRVSLPVQGAAGAWSVHSPWPAHVELLNLDPVVAYGDPARLIQSAAPPLRRPEPILPSPQETFVPGVMSQAVQLAGDRTLSFPAGERLADGSTRHLPTTEGTIELWFRPNWSSSELAFRDGQLLQRDFLRAGAINFYYRYGQGPVRDNLYSYVDLLTRGKLGAPGRETDGLIGGHARHFMQKAQWVHLAATWQLQQGKRGTEGSFAVFVNGEKMEPTWNYPRSLTGRDPYRLQEVAARIVLGACDGCLDELRVSRVRRYEGDFTPSRQPFAPDAQTAALFHFDGSLNGLSGAEGAVIAAQ